jgi:hypothetical protein
MGRQEVVHPSHHFELGFLHDIGSIHADQQPCVQADFDARVQVGPVAGQESLQSLPIALCDALEQAARLCRVCFDLHHHPRPLISNPKFPGECDRQVEKIAQMAFLGKESDQMATSRLEALARRFLSQPLRRQLAQLIVD